MKILMLGAGGVGGYFGARLIEAGADVTFLVRPARKALIEARGLRIESPHGDLSLQPACVTRDGLRPVYDLVVLAAKAYDLDDAIASVRPAIGPSTRLLPFLNGLSHLASLDRHFGRARVLGGVAHVAGELTRDGVVRQLTEMHSLTAGGRDAATQAVAREFIALCSGAKFVSVLAEDIEAVLWEKWTFLATLAGLTTLLRASVGEIVASARGEPLIRRFYAECLAIAAACGKPVAEAGQGRAMAMAMLSKPGSTLSASMRRDLEAGLRTEHEHVLGEMLALADAHGVDAPLLAIALTQMRLRERERAGA